MLRVVGREKEKRGDERERNSKIERERKERIEKKLIKLEDFKTFFQKLFFRNLDPLCSNF